jgi:hypothetical protein
MHGSSLPPTGTTNTPSAPGGRRRAASVSAP